jgi:DNA-binding response OmpR family regulator
MVGARPVSLHILVADDEPMVVRVVGEALRLSGHRVDVAHNGRDALRSWHEAEYDLLILDAMMDRQSGVEVATRVREHGSAVPIVLLSAASRPTDRLDPLAYTLKAEILRKPFGARELGEAVDRAMGRLDG